MKTKLLVLIVAMFSFASSCDTEEIQEQGCDCRKMYYEKQVVTGGFQFVFTNRGEFESVDCEIKQSGTLQPNGFIWTTFYPIDVNHNYRWECKNE